MEIIVKVSTTYNCSLERAFKTPLLCDVSKIHTGYGLMPKVTHCIEDNNWGKVGSSKKVYAAKSLTQKGGFASVDKIIERVENEYWKFQVDDFQSWMLGFYKFVGEWKTAEIEPNKTSVEYTYTLHSDIALLYPLNWLFAKTFWKTYMKRVLENVRQMAYDNEPYKYKQNIPEPHVKSLDHAWSSGPAAFLPARLFGLEPLEDGWKRFAMNPNLDYLKWASVNVPGKYGNITVDIEKDTVHLLIPEGTTLEWKGNSIKGPRELIDKI